jgi:hypothetical protein
VSTLGFVFVVVVAAALATGFLLAELEERGGRPRRVAYAVATVATVIFFLALAWLWLL